MCLVFLLVGKHKTHKKKNIFIKKQYFLKFYFKKYSPDGFLKIRIKLSLFFQYPLYF